MWKDTYNYRGWTTSDSFVKRAISMGIYAAIGTLLLQLFLVLASLLLGFIGFTLYGGAMSIDRFWLPPHLDHFWRG